MAESFLIFFLVVGIIILIAGGFKIAVEFQDVIFGLVILAIGIGLIVGGVALLVKVGGGVGAFGILMALFGGVVTWFGKSIIKDDL